jgi:hypothetical protein
LAQAVLHLGTQGAGLNLVLNHGTETARIRVGGVERQPTLTARSKRVLLISATPERYFEQHRDDVE